MNEHPFARTPVIITAIIAGFALLGGIIVIVGFSPDAGPRISSILTITVPTLLVSLVGIAVSLRNGRIVSATQDKVDANTEKVNIVSQKTDGTLAALVNHVTGKETLSTGEIPVVVQRATDLINGTGGK